MRASKKLTGALATAAVSFLLACLCLYLKPAFIEDLENRSWDWRAKLVAKTERADKNIKLIVIDQASLDFFEQEYSLTWPIPRSAYVHVISFLQAAGAKGIAFDMLFTESSAQSLEGDQEFAAAVGGKLPVVNALNLESYEKFMNADKLAAFRKRQLEQSIAEHWKEKYFSAGSIHHFKSATLPIPELISASSGLGTVHATPDRDGIYRRYQTGGMLNDIPVLSLPFALLEATKTILPSNFRPADSGAVIRTHGPSGTYAEIPLAKVIQADAEREEGKPPRVTLETFKDSWVFLGATAPGLLDLRPTSLEERGHGLELVASTFDNLLHDDFIRFPSLTTSILSMFVLVALASLIAFGARDLGLQVSLLALLGTVFGSAAVHFASQGWWIPVVVPCLGIASAAFLGIGMQYQLEGKQSRFLRKAFQSYVSPQVVEQLVSQPELLALNGEKRELSMFFSDVEGFTTLAEKLDPNTLVPILNEYLSLMSGLIQSSGGTVDKYVGDAVVAFWNAPMPVGEHASRAVETAIKCQQKLAELAPHFQEEYGISLRTRIGVNTALVTVGNFGSEDRFTFTMIGDGVNLASRIESINKVFGTLLLITDATESLMREKPRMRLVGKIRVAGKKEAVKIFEPFLDDSQWVFRDKNLELFTNALSAFEAGDWLEAQKLFRGMSADPVAKAYAERIDAMLRDEVSRENWSPIWEFFEK